MQVGGCKRFALFHPKYYTSFYPFPLAHPCDRQSQVDMYNPNLERFPRFPEAVGVFATVHPGDLLYLPPFWWHHVECRQDSISVNFWFEMAKADPSMLKYPLSAQQVLAIRRNVERIIGQVIPHREIGTFCTEMVAGRYVSCSSHSD
jgi:hypoxia-inducible factor 1-alpha inhibitor (HIF hydroxylase)